MGTQARRNSHHAGARSTPLQSLAPVQPLVDLVATQMDMWRHSADLSRTLIRMQQDQMLQFWRIQSAPPGAGDGQSSTGAAWPFEPLLASLGAAGRLGAAALTMQREAFAALLPRDHDLSQRSTGRGAE